MSMAVLMLGNRLVQVTTTWSQDGKEQNTFNGIYIHMTAIINTR